MNTTKYPRFANRNTPTPEGVSIAHGVIYVQGCTYCIEQLREGRDFFPPHTASSACQSGGGEHCACDICF